MVVVQHIFLDTLPHEAYTAVYRHILQQLSQLCLIARVSSRFAVFEPVDHATGDTGSYYDWKGVTNQGAKRPESIEGEGGSAPNHQRTKAASK